MKYIRVYEGDYVESEYLTTYQEHCEHVANIQDNGFDFEGCIIKQADTIEELCDEFVLGETECFHKPFVTTLPLGVLKEHAIKKRPYGLIVYGAIWTDKGLIYVAKMNSKGELELL